MKLPFLWIAMGFSLGIALEKYVLIPSVWPISMLGGGIVVLWFLRGRRLFLPLFILCLGCAGILWARLDAHVPANAIQNFTGPERITLRGVVDSLPERKTLGKKTTISLVLKARSVTRQENGRRKFHKVSGQVQVFLLQSPVLPQVGDELRLYGTLSLPRQVLNPGEFDYGHFLAQKNIHAVFQLIGKKCVRVTRTGARWAPGRLIADARRRLAMLVDRLYKPPEAAILKALVLGLRSDVAPEVRSQFMKTGTIHLLAISGLNITMIAGTFYLMFLFSGLGHRKTALLTILIVIVYVGLAGAGVPVQRAGYASVMVLFGVLIGRPANLLNALCFAFFVLLLWNPRNLWNIGFQLSFLSVFSLILVLPLLSRFSAWTLSLGSSLAVLLGTFPVVLYHFNIFSPVSILANLVAIPLFDAALFSALFTLIFSGVPFLNMFLIKGSSWILGIGLIWIEYLSTWRWGYWFLEQPSLGRLAAYYTSVAMILFFYKEDIHEKHWLMTGFICCWIIFSVSFFVGSGGKGFKLTMLASGRNQIVYARFSNEAHWLLNAGRNFPSNQGEWLIAPFLRNQGIQRLEGILLTDLSKKHTGGLVAVLRDFPVRHFLYPAAFTCGSGEFYKNLLKLGRKAKTFQQGDEVLMGTEKIRMIVQSQKGTVFLIESRPWRILLISRWDPVLFRELLRDHEDAVEIHAVFLPASGQGIPGEFQDWLDRTRPLLAVLPDLQQELAAHLASRRIPCLDLKHTGALDFKKNGPRLELTSFLKGSLGVYSYS
ncbi:MAG: ComEC/Rec2 family competence protein [Candidatus Omnitrophota bacterium]|jgi:competence protein ComEC